MAIKFIKNDLAKPEHSWMVCDSPLLTACPMIKVADKDITPERWMSLTDEDFIRDFTDKSHLKETL